MNNTQLYYLFLAIVLVVGIAIQIKLPAGEEHYLGANTTRNESNCTTTFMGGWDYDSFFGDVRVNNISFGHIPAGTVVYDGPCKNVTITSYAKPVHSYVVVYSYKYL